MTSITTDDPLMARAKALKLYGLLAHWQEVAGNAWIEPLIQWEEAERACRSLERRLGSARLGRFRPLADFDWDWPKRCDREAVEELMHGESVLARLSLEGRRTVPGVVGHAQVVEDQADIARQALDGRGDGIAGLGPDGTGGEAA